jgi:hypothetical protein
MFEDALCCAAGRDPAAAGCSAVFVGPVPEVDRRIGIGGGDPNMENIVPSGALFPVA